MSTLTIPKSAPPPSVLIRKPPQFLVRVSEPFAAGVATTRHLQIDAVDEAQAKAKALNRFGLSEDGNRPFRLALYRLADVITYEPPRNPA